MKTLCIITGELRCHLKIIDEFYSKLILPNEMDVFYFLSKNDFIYKNELLEKINSILKNKNSKLIGIHFQNLNDDIDECKTMVFRRIKDFVKKHYSSQNVNSLLNKLNNQNAEINKNDKELINQIANFYYPYQGLHQWYKLKRSFFYLRDELKNYDFILRIRPDIDFQKTNMDFKNITLPIHKKWVLVRWDFMIFSYKELFVSTFSNFFKYFEEKCFPDKLNKDKLNLYCNKTNLKKYAEMFKYQFRIYSEHLLLQYLIENEIFVIDHPYKLSISNVRNLNDKQINMVFKSENEKKEKEANQKILNHHNYKISIRFLKNNYKFWCVNDWLLFCQSKNIIICQSYFYENDKPIILKPNDFLNNYFGKTIINKIT